MNAQEAKIIILEDALRQAQNTVEFLHGCLTDPKGFNYAYPSHTLVYLKEWDQLAPRSPYCIHSFFKEDCEGCIVFRADRAQLYEARKTLGIKNEQS